MKALQHVVARRLSHAPSVPETVTVPTTTSPVSTTTPTTSTTTASSLSPAMQWLIQKESGGRTTAKNPRSSAFGLGQLLKGNRQRYAAKLGIQNPDTTDYNEQLRMMQQYITDRYGSPEKAQEFHRRKGWY